jgi:protocatechuate 3,4-dioxygenase beta subunit
LQSFTGKPCLKYIAVKQIILSILLSIPSANLHFGQTGKEALIKEAEEKLKPNKASISQILTDKKYDAIHPETSFRNLIEKYCKAETISITSDTIPGKRIKVIGSVKNSESKPVADAVVYLYHTDSRGWYAADAPHVLQYEGDIRHARLFGYVKTDKNGMFELHTIKPSGYPKSDLPAHIHVHVSAAGYQSYVTEFLFDDDERLIGNIRTNAIRNQFLISKPEKSSAPFEQQFSYIMQLQKLSE